MKDMKIAYELKFQGRNFYKGKRYNHPYFHHHKSQFDDENY